MNEQTAENLLHALKANTIKLIQAAKAKDSQQIKNILQDIKNLERKVYRQVRKSKDISRTQRHLLDKELAEIQALRHRAEVDLDEGEFGRIKVDAGEEEILSSKLESDILKKGNYLDNPIYQKLCTLAGEKPIKFKELSKKLIKKEQEKTIDSGYENKSESQAPLYNVVMFIGNNFNYFKSIPGFIHEISFLLFLWYIHMIQSYILQQKLSDAKRLMPFLISWQKLTPGFQYHDNHGPLLFQAFFSHDLKLFEKIARESYRRHTGFGWDGKKGYERPIVYGMHATLQGVPTTKILQTIQSGDIKDIDIHDLGLKESIFYKVRELFHIL